MKGNLQQFKDMLFSRVAHSFVRLPTRTRTPLLLRPTYTVSMPLGPVQCIAPFRISWVLTDVSNDTLCYVLTFLCSRKTRKIHKRYTGLFKDSCFPLRLLSNCLPTSVTRCRCMKTFQLRTATCSSGCKHTPISSVKQFTGAHCFLTPRCQPRAACSEVGRGW